jgi:hypothetical protein
MIEVALNDNNRSFIKKYANYQNIGGFSNLAKTDLSKASRLDFQMTGVAGEAGWFLYRYNNLDKLTSILDYKFNTLRPIGKGDNGFDDSITHNNKTRYVDIKSSHIENKERIKFLNLVIPQREFHDNMIYVCAFTIGKDRRNVNSVILAGWAITEDVHKKWAYDNSKYCVPVGDLRDIKELDEYIQ